MEFNKEPDDRQRGQLLETMYTTIQVLSWESQKQATAIMDSFGLTLPQGIVLLTLDSLGGRAKMSELVKLIQISGGTLTGIVDRLIAADLLQRERIETDRRVVFVSLTEAGQEKLEAMRHYQRVHLEMATASFNNAELEQFNTLLTKFLQAAGVTPEMVQNYNNYAKNSV